MITTILVFLASGAAGLGHALLLAAAARRGPSALAGLARIAVIVGVLVFAAKAGHLLLGASAWAAFFAIGLVFAWRRLHRRAP